MTRNLHHRIEVCVPVKDLSLADQLKKYFDIQWNDNAKASPAEEKTVLYPLSLNTVKPEDSRCSQQEIYNYLKTRQ
jgi:polyphosphate kinase